MTYDELLARAPKASDIGDVASAKVYTKLLVSELATNTDIFTVSQKAYVWRLIRKWKARTTDTIEWKPPGRPIHQTTVPESRSIAAKAMKRHERENESPLLKTIMSKYGTPREDEFRYLKTPTKGPQ